MGFLVIIPFGALAGWSIFAITRWFRRGGYDRQWRKAFAMLATAGVALGIWFTFFLQYSVANVHLRGFPIPVGIANREKPGEPYISSDMPMAIRVGAIVTDLLSGVAICLAPIAGAMFLKENRKLIPGSDPRPQPHSPP